MNQHAKGPQSVGWENKRRKSYIVRRRFIDDSEENFTCVLAKTRNTNRSLEKNNIFH